jgi:adenine-specific DNA-methyltransferase
MASLAEREGLRGQVQCIYFDPPYGIKFNSNFGYIRISPTSKWRKTHCGSVKGVFHTERNPAGI